MKTFTKKELQAKVKVTCYGKTRTMTRGEAIDYFLVGAECCDGSEADRYMTIYIQLMKGLTEVSDQY